MLRFVLSFVFLFVSLKLFSQEIQLTGRCVDKKRNGVSDVRIRMNDSDTAIFSDRKGFFSISALVGDSIKIQYFLIGEQIPITQLFFVKDIHSTKIPTMELNIKEFSEVTIIENVETPFELNKIKIKDWQLLPIQNIEQALIFTSAARSNNELTANYNVRGGNYDENLVYVNGFQIYRPFLTRAGQQEGMSFINSALVESLSFSAGGFDAQYGDKLSSVLDIHYRKPQKQKASAMISLLGVETHVEQQLGKRERLSYLLGARYRSNGYFLNALPTKGTYNPTFWDAQLLTEYVLTENWSWSTLLHFSSNKYAFAPTNQKTDMGIANQAYTFMIYFDGQEQTKFQTMLGGTKLDYQSNDKKTKLGFYITAFQSDEREYFDISGEYFINQLETDLSKEEFGDSIDVVGVGAFLNHARNRLKATIFNLYHTGSYEVMNKFKDQQRTKHQQIDILWGINYQHDNFRDTLSEWKLIDSAGFSIPQKNDKLINLDEVIKVKLNLQSYRTTAHLQMNAIWSKTKRNYPIRITKSYTDSERNKSKIILLDTLASSTNKWALSVGTRAGYTSVNEETFITPRLSLIFYPRSYFIHDSTIERRNSSVRLSTGLYFQPPMYREFRTFQATLNTHVKAQKSYHAVLGYDYFFYMMKRNQPFKLSAELYYKYLWDVNPYKVENVRTRYYADNNAIAYATGIDLNLNGEFIEGIESFFKIGIMRTHEDIKNDSYIDYYNAKGEKILFGLSEDQKIVDSVVVKPSYIPRPTDQLITFGMLIQDRMPSIEALSVQLALQFGSRLPYGPPGLERYADTLRMKSYFRIDFGTSYDFTYRKKVNSNSESTKFIQKILSDAILSFEIYNLFGINNELSKQWIQDVNSRWYSIPNHLTQRRFNLKLIARF